MAKDRKNYVSDEVIAKHFKLEPDAIRSVIDIYEIGKGTNFIIKKNVGSTSLGSKKEKWYIHKSLHFEICSRLSSEITEVPTFYRYDKEDDFDALTPKELTQSQLLG